jgi:hypothetical protein
MNPMLICTLLYQFQIPTHRITVDYQNGDIREAVRYLMKTAPNLTYTMDLDVTGPVTVKLTDVTFGDALKYVLKSANASYRVEDGVIAIHSDRTINQTDLPRGISERPTNPLLAKEIRNFRAKSEPAYQVIRRALDEVGASYVVSDAVNAPVSLSIQRATLRDILTAILASARGRLIEGKNIITITSESP